MSFLVSKMPTFSLQDDDQDSNISNKKNNELDNKLTEQRLIDSLEKQRQLQQQQQQQLLMEEQKKEEERKARLRAEEEERLRKMRESNNLHKQPLSQKTQNHENYYENTMNAAGIYL